MSDRQLRAERQLYAELCADTLVRRWTQNPRLPYSDLSYPRGGTLAERTESQRRAYNAECREANRNDRWNCR